MHKRLVSYILFLATIIAVFMVVVIQPQSARRHIKNMNPNAPLFADSCTASGMGMTCEEYAAMVAAMTACSSTGGIWNGISCTAVASTCNGQSCTAMTCQAAGYTWDAGSQTCLVGGGGSAGASSAPPVIDGVGASEKLSQRIESKCLDHVAKSGYAQTLADYGWFENIRIYAKNACTLAYLATNGKYGSNNDLYSVASLITNDDAKQQEDIGILYQALEDIPARSVGQSLDDYLDATKDGAAKRLKDIMDIMDAFNVATTDQKLNPSYLTEPLPYVLKKSAAAYNATHNTKIISLEEKLLALIPKPAPVALEESEKKVAEEVPPVPERPTIIKKVAEPAEEGQSISQRVVIVLNKIVNKLKGIREEGIENGITRKTITPDLGTLQKDFLQTQKVIETFDACLENGVC